MSPSRSVSPSASSLLVKGYAVAVQLVAFGVLVNAFIAGRALIGDWDILVHGIIGNGVFVLAVIALVLAVVLRAGRVTIVAAALLAGLVFAQVGLGYSGRNSPDAMAWHIPNGVLIFGLAVWTAARGAAPVTQRPRA
jgi:hypothetical protein